MHEAPRLRFWFETVVGTFAAVLALITLAWREWIEAVFGVDPDHGNGSAEWIAVALLLGIALALGALARREWRASAPGISTRS